MKTLVTILILAGLDADLLQVRRGGDAKLIGELGRKQMPPAAKGTRATSQGPEVQAEWGAGSGPDRTENHDGGTSGMCLTQRRP